MPDLALLSLLCSKLCHDLVGPVSAIGNGVEILEEEDDPAMQKQAVELLAHSANLAANRLKFMRLAFGAAGGEGVAISLTEARQTANDFLIDGRGKLNWPVVEDEDALGVDKTGVKILLNLIMIANDTIPRGGTVGVSLRRDEENGQAVIHTVVRSEGANARLGEGVEDALDTASDSNALNPKSAPARLAANLAQTFGQTIFVMPHVDSVEFTVGLTPNG
ncbi:MAG: histidine phosphotransferase [Rhodospirillaceae bacterium]|jgi:histidine phosphotransferase ChpT|nr:histidine phosphotransferase [Rhodospirillaceae bacterium]MBT5879179.1 histidine phosphotransferase [Rhodospirillaceae bacterium]MBT7147068.1 histidine phosphotransferase [Rhodospirillales bacterium]